MPGTELAFMLAAVACILIGFIVLVRFFRAWLMHRSLRQAIERDSSAAPALIERIAALDANRGSLDNDDRNGMVLIAFGLALAGFAVVAFGAKPDVLRIILGSSLFPLLVGIALLVRRKLLKRELAAEGEAANHPGA